MPSIDVPHPQKEGISPHPIGSQTLNNLLRNGFDSCENQSIKVGSVDWFKNRQIFGLFFHGWGYFSGNLFYVLAEGSGETGALGSGSERFWYVVSGKPWSGGGLGYTGSIGYKIIALKPSRPFTWWIESLSARTLHALRPSVTFISTR